MTKAKDFLAVLGDLGGYAKKLETYRDLIVGNIIRVGEESSVLPDPPIDPSVDPFLGNERARAFGERLLEIGIDECSIDGAGNPVGIIKGRKASAPPILVAAEIDSKYQPDWDWHYSVSAEAIKGPGVTDNAVAAACLVTIADLARLEDMTFDSDIYLVGFANTTVPGNDYGAIDRFLANLGQKTRGALILKGTELGRVNYFTRATLRATIACERKDEEDRQNMILVGHEILEGLLAIRLPQKPSTELIVGKFSGGAKFGSPAECCEMGIELRSDSTDILDELASRLADVVESVGLERGVNASLRVKSRRGAKNIGYDHPLTRASLSALASLGVEPAVSASYSELFFFLDRGVAAITLGMTEGRRQQTDEAEALIAPLYKGLAQIVGLLRTMDGGLCDA